MENREKILEGYSDLEKGAYLGAIASLATADRVASDEEVEYISELCDAASLSPEQKQYVVRAATELSGEELNECLEVLKKSELKFSLVADLIAFSRADADYSEEEQQSVHRISEHLQLDEKQFTLLDQFAGKAMSPEIPQQEKSDPSFLSTTGLQDKMQNAGINPGSLLNGFLGIAGPMILGSLLSGGMRRGQRSGFGGAMGGMMGGGGGLGSLIGMLSGGRGFGSTGGLLGRMMGGRGW